MSYSPSGLNDALAGVIAEGTHLALNTADPGTTGAGVDVAVVTQLAAWGAPAAGAVDSSEVPFAVPAGGGTRVYTHFSVWDGPDTTTAVYKTGGALDEQETFSDNGGTYNFTATLTAQNVP